MHSVFGFAIRIVSWYFKNYKISYNYLLL